MRTSLIFLCFLSIPALPVFAQSVDTVFCQVCGEPNAAANNFCTSCGAKLAGRVRLTSDRSRETRGDSVHAYRRPPRLFSLPTATALPESYLCLTFGNNFGIQVGESILGTVSVGVGDIGEIELSTAGLVTSVVDNAPGFKTAGIRISLFGGTGALPAAGVLLRSSSDWDHEDRGAQVIEATDPRAYDVGLRSLSIESRIASINLFISKQTSIRTTLHAGIGFADIRYRNVQSVFMSSSVYDESENRTNQWQAFGGFSIILNSRTLLLAEIQTLPLFRYDVNRSTIRLGRMYVGAGGIRFSLTPVWSLDGGIRYQDNFVGLADMQFRVALNAIIVLP